MEDNFTYGCQRKWLETHTSKIDFMFLDEREQFESEQVEGGASLWAEKRGQIPANFFNTSTGKVYENTYGIGTSMLNFGFSVSISIFMVSC